MKPFLVYAPGDDFTLPGFDWLDPFDGRKYSRAWRLIEERLGPVLGDVWQSPAAPAGDAELLRVHTAAYLASLESPAVVAQALEIWALKLLSRGVVQKRLLQPMRLAVAGTILATRRAPHRRGGGRSPSTGEGL